MDAATRSWPPIDPLCLRWRFPLWEPDELLDPTLLRRPPARQRKSPPEQPKDPQERTPAWTVDRFVEQFVKLEPQPKTLITARAREAGIANRRVEYLVLLAESQNRVFR